MTHINMKYIESQESIKEKNLKKAIDSSKKNLNTLKNSSISINRNINSENEERKINCVYCLLKFIIYGIIIGVNITIIICDLYYGYNGNSCISESLNNTGLNLRLYLIASGYIGIFVLVIATSIIIINIIAKLNTFIIIITNVITYIVLVLYCVWNILCIFIFLKYLLNGSLCTKETINYLYTSLAIKIFLVLFCNFVIIFKCVTN